MLYKLIFVLCLLSVPCLSQTKVKISQIKNWQQISNLTSKGTSISIDQIDLNTQILMLWKKESKNPLYYRYRAAVVENGKHVILITCDKRWGSCDERFPLWFELNY